LRFGAAGGLVVAGGARVSIAPLVAGDVAESEWLVRRCGSKVSRLGG